MDRIFKPPFSMTRAISQDRQSCQFLFLLDEKLTVVPVGAAGEGSVKFEFVINSEDSQADRRYNPAQRAGSG